MLSGRFVLRWMAAFGFTQLVEVPIYRRTLHRGLGPCFGASAITHPLVWLFLRSGMWCAPRAVQVGAVELFAWLVEAAYFRVGFGSGRVLRWTFVANAASFTLGLASRTLFGCP
jgi:hypothetical protein